MDDYEPKFWFKVFEQRNQKKKKFNFMLVLLLLLVFMIKFYYCVGFKFN